MKFIALDLAVLEKTLDAGSYTVADLASKGLCKKGTLVKLLGKGPVSKKFQLTVNASSKGAKDAVAKAGGAVVIAK